MTTLHRQVSAPHRRTITCKGSAQHAAPRMSMNDLDNGTREAGQQRERVLTCDPGLGFVRRTDAGYAGVTAAAARAHIDMPMGTPGGLRR